MRADCHMKRSNNESKDDVFSFLVCIFSLALGAVLMLYISKTVALIELATIQTRRTVL